MFPSFFVCGQRCQTFMTYSFTHVTAIFFALPACLPGLRVCLARVSLSLLSLFLAVCCFESFLIKRANRIRVKLSMVEGATSACHTKKMIYADELPALNVITNAAQHLIIFQKENSLSCQLQVNTIRQILYFFFFCCSPPDMTRSDSNKGMRR